MIVKMKKATLFVLESHQSQALKDLRKLGVVHLNIKKGESEDSAQLKEKYTLIEKALKVLSQEETDAPIEKGKNNTFSADDAARKVLELSGQRTSLQEQLNLLEREKIKLSPWGELDTQILESLKQHGYDFTFMEIQLKDLEKISEDVEYIKLKTDDKKAYIGILGDPEKIGLSYDLIDLQSNSLKDIQIQLDQAAEEIAKLQSEILNYTKHIDFLKTELKTIQKRIEFEEIRCAMGRDVKIAYLQGFVPVDELDNLKKTAAEKAWGLVLEEPGENDMVPTKLKSWAKKLIDPIYALLGTVPGYHEMDISFWFLIFFTVFFAMIIGDAGYGLVIMVGVVIARLKIKGFKGGPFILFFLLSAATILWGVVTGTWFGYEKIYEIPILSDVIIPQIASSPADGSMDSMFIVMNICFILGTVHLVLAHFLSLLKKLPKLSFLAEVGNIVFIIAMFMLIQNLVLSKTNPVDPIIWMTGIGFAMIFIFSNQEGGHFFKRVLKNLADFLPLTLGSIGNFSDIISYIRLFAVGLATVKVADAFNDIAVMVGEIHPVAIVGAIIVILIGHSLNIVMAGMSVIVHGVRLKMLEFSGHLGMEWSGTEYKPFKED